MNGWEIAWSMLEPRSYSLYNASRQDDAFNSAAGQMQIAKDYPALMKAHPSVSLPPEHAAILEKYRDKQAENMAAPQINKFMNDYSKMTGTNNMRFLSDPDFRAELQKPQPMGTGVTQPGLTIPNDGNPFLTKQMQGLTEQGRQMEMAGRALKDSNDFDAKGYLATNKDIAGGMENITQADHWKAQTAGATAKTADEAKKQKNIDEADAAMRGFDLKFDPNSYLKFNEEMQKYGEYGRKQYDHAAKLVENVPYGEKVIVSNGTQKKVKTNIFGAPIPEFSATYHANQSNDKTGYITVTGDDGTQYRVNKDDPTDSTPIVDDEGRPIKKPGKAKRTLSLPAPGGGKEATKPETGTSASGKPMVKIGNTWYYQ